MQILQGAKICPAETFVKRDDVFKSECRNLKGDEYKFVKCNALSNQSYLIRKPT